MITIRNNASVEIHGIAPGEERAVKAAPDGKVPLLLEHRKRINDGTFSIVKPPAKASKPAKGE